MGAIDSLRLFTVEQAVKIVLANVMTPSLLSPKGSEPQPAELKPDGQVVYNYVGVGASPQVVMVPRSPDQLASEVLDIAQRLLAYVERGGVK